jgi:type IV pilus assembly protein PilQ
MRKEGLLMRVASMTLGLVLAAPLVMAAATAPPTGVESPSTLTEPLGIPANLLSVHVDAEYGDLSVSLVGDGPLQAESFTLTGPYRLVVDLPGVVNRTSETRIDVDHDDVIQLRVAQFRLEPTPIARIVLDLDRPVGYDVRRDGDGLVIDFGDASGDFVATAREDLPVWAGGTRRAEPAPPVVEIVEVAPPAPVEPIAEPPLEVEPEIVETTEPSAQLSEAAPPAPIEAPAAEPVAEPTPVASLEIAEPEIVEATEVVAATPTDASRSLAPDALDKLLGTPPLAAKAAPQQSGGGSSSGADFETRTIVTEAVNYSGKRISLNLVDANIKEVFRLFHEISGINFVLDPSVDGRVTIVVDNVPWDQTLDLILKNNGLDKVLEGNVIRIASTEKLAAEAAQRKQLKEAKELEVEPITITRTLSYAKSKDVERVIREGGVLSQRGKVIVDERTNTLIISDIPKKVDPLDQLISTLDSETPQVMIEARIVETSRDFSRDLGVVWGFAAVADASRGTSTGLPFPNQASVRYGLNLPGDGGASNLAFKFGNILDSFTLDVALNTLESEGRGRVLSAPKIATQNNERAEIEQGTRIPVVNTTATEINVEFVSASLRLEVTPQITAEGTIILDVVVENNSPDFVNTVGEVPPINTQRAQTKVLITDGGTTVIGGIFQVNEGQNEVGVPWFRKVPLFGWLFKTQNITRQNRELLIFLTPKILKLS